jgi:hypothetical protein
MAVVKLVEPTEERVLAFLVENPSQTEMVADPLEFVALEWVMRSPNRSN